MYSSGGRSALLFRWPGRRKGLLLGPTYTSDVHVSGMERHDDGADRGGKAQRVHVARWLLVELRLHPFEAASITRGQRHELRATSGDRPDWVFRRPNRDARPDVAGLGHVNSRLRSMACGRLAYAESPMTLDD